MHHIYIMSSITRGIQYLSDLHLEFLTTEATQTVIDSIIPTAKICVLAGDIGYPYQETYSMFLHAMNQKFEHTFLIHGNHEYYQLKENAGYITVDMVHKTREVVAPLQNVHFLHNEHYDLGEHRFIGSTLWSHIYDPKYLVNDAHRIGDFSVATNNARHRLHKRYIRDSLLQTKKEHKKAIVITHHLPSFTLSDPKYQTYHLYTQCFASSCDDMIASPVQCWIFGHTHAVTDKRINDIPCLANPIGYPNENTDVDYNRIYCSPDFCSAIVPIS
jgi:predicted phosphodiesterase